MQPTNMIWSKTKISENRTQCPIVYAPVPHAPIVYVPHAPSLYTPVPHAPKCNDFFQNKCSRNVLKHVKLHFLQKSVLANVVKHVTMVLCSKKCYGKRYKTCENVF